jgi:beta-lactamase regulating signal transducer with metallopeptidase domain
MAMAVNMETAMGLLAACTVKTTVLLTLAWFAATVLSKQSAAARHRAWAAGILTALALPVCSALLPAMVVNASTASPWLRELSGMLLLFWVAGAVISIARLASGLLQLARGTTRAKQIVGASWRGCCAEICGALKIARPVRLMDSGSPVTIPLTWGMFRPVVMLPANSSKWPETQRRAVLLHELAHVARYDWFLQSCGELARSLYWFHPLAWMAARNLRRESERACDDAVLTSGIDAREIRRPTARSRTDA